MSTQPDETKSQDKVSTPDYATTGVDNPLKKYSDSEKAQLASSEQKASQAYAAWKDAEHQGLAKEKVEELKAIAMEKDEILRGMQDLCD